MSTPPAPLPLPRPLAAETVAVVAGRPPHGPDAPVNPPLVLSSTYGATAPGEAGRVYDRQGNEVWEAFESALAGLEGGPALLWSSGMAAISAVVGLVPHGGIVVVPRHAYSLTLALVDELASTGALQVRRVDVADTDQVAGASQGADLVWLESPTNPMLEVADLPAVIAAATAAGALTAVDNTFATPLGQRPLDHGADVVVHSVTKYLAGHSDVVLGATCTRSPDLLERLRRRRTLHGAVPGAFDVWLALRGLRTLAVRVEKSQRNAADLAVRLHALIGTGGVVAVRHPSLPTDPGHARASAQMNGYGSIVTVELTDADRAEQVAAAVRLWTHATSLGGVESTLERRRRHGAEPVTVPEGLLRLSVGIEDVEDLWDDLSRVLR